MSLDCILAAECADIAGVLRDFHLLYLLSQRGTVSVGIVSDEQSIIRQRARGVVVTIWRSLRLRKKRCIPRAIFTGYADLCTQLSVSRALGNISKSSNLLFVRFVILETVDEVVENVVGAVELSIAINCG